MISFQKNISSSFFQYSERTIASTETNYTSKESLGRGIIRGLLANLPLKYIEKKVNLMKESQEAKKKIAPILLLYYEESVCQLRLNYKVHLESSLTCQTYC